MNTNSFVFRPSGESSHSSCQAFILPVTLPFQSWNLKLVQISDGSNAVCVHCLNTSLFSLSKPVIQILNSRKILLYSCPIILIAKDVKRLDQINYNDPLWINDYCQISDYWFLDDQAPNLFEAAKIL